MMRIIFIVFVVLVSPEIMAGHGGGHGDAHINWFGWDTESPPVAWFILNFVVLFGFLGYFLRKKVNQFFNDRYENMKRQMDESVKIREEALAKLREIEEKLAKIDYYRNAIRDEYIDMAKKEKEDIINHARRNAQSLRSSAEQTILFEALELRKEIIRQIIRSAAEKSLKRILAEYSLTRDREIIEDFIGSLKSVDKKSFGYIV
ncbi:MAG: ATP synthase F0 subunit B [Deltaproteobacteria bacterium]|nr:ATP synthase F0 subunit B [Deltaproteobacteria bacterium]